MDSEPSEKTNVDRMSGPQTLHSITVDIEKASVALCPEIENQDFIVDWNGSDDPEMAVNWPAKKKWATLSIVSVLTLLTPFASSMLAPGMDQVMKDFHSTNIELSSFVISVYLLGYAFGPLLIAPLSELYGRNPIYHFSIVSFVLFNLLGGLSRNLGMLIAFRLLMGVAGSGPLTLGAGSIADMFIQEQRGRAMALWVLPVLLGPALGPLVGAYLSASIGWRWNFWLLTIVTAAVFLVSLVFLKETYPPAILECRARRLGKERPNSKLRSALQPSTPSRQLFLKSIFRPMRLLFLEPAVLLLSICTAIVYGFLYLLFTTMTNVFETEYQVSSGNVGLMYLSCGAGQIIGMTVFGMLSDRLLKRIANGGDLKPKYRLPPLYIGLLAMAAGLLCYGWSVAYTVQIVCPIVGLVFIGAGIIWTNSSVTTFLIDAYSSTAASANAANTVLRSVGGALVPLFGGRMYSALGLGWGNTLLALIAIATLVMVWVAMRILDRRAPLLRA